MAPQPRPPGRRYMHCRQTVFCLVLVLATGGLTTCSRKKTISRDELRSEIKSAYSFVAESEMFIDYIRQGHATRHYTQAHATYLKERVTQLEKELAQAVPEPATADVVRECRTCMALLHRELSTIAIAAGDNAALDAARKRIENLRRSLGKAYSYL